MKGSGGGTVSRVSREATGKQPGDKGTGGGRRAQLRKGWAEGQGGNIRLPGALLLRACPPNYNTSTDTTSLSLAQPRPHQTRRCHLSPLCCGLGSSLDLSSALGTRPQYILTHPDHPEAFTSCRGGGNLFREAGLVPCQGWRESEGGEAPLPPRSATPPILQDRAGQAERQCSQGRLLHLSAWTSFRVVRWSGHWVAVAGGN